MGAVADVRVSDKHRALVVPYREDIKALMPHVKTDGKVMILPHGREETKMLRNMGMQAPAPVLHQYDWGGTAPFDNQKETAAMLTMNRRVYVLSEMGVGKTRAAIFAIDFLLRMGEAKKVLIVAPLSTLNPTWRSEIMRVMPTEKVAVLHGSRQRRLQLMAEDARIHVINHDGIQVVQKAMLQCAYDIVVVDELLMYRNPRTDRWKSLNPISSQAKFVWGMTGAPTPNSPLDAYGQIKLLTPTRVSSFTNFRDRVMQRLSTFTWIARPAAADTIHGMMQPSVRFKLRDCHDIPDTTYMTRVVPLSKVQDKFYKAVFTHAKAQYQQHAITAVNEGVKLNKLLQISGGYVYTAEKKVLGLNPAPRLQELSDLLQECEHKAIVFVPYIPALKQVLNHVLKTHTAEMIYGQTSKRERDRIFYEFQHSDTPRVLVAQPGAMSHGLTLTRSKMIVWYSATSNLDTYIQANARIVRAGQTDKTVIVHLESTAVERRAFKRLQAKEKLQGMLLGLFEGTSDE